MQTNIMVVATTLLFLSSLSDFNAQVLKSTLVMNMELKKIDFIYYNMSPAERKRLEQTYIGDGSMSEYDVLSMAHDQIQGGIESYNYYLKHYKAK